MALIPTPPVVGSDAPLQYRKPRTPPISGTTSSASQALLTPAGAGGPSLNGAGAPATPGTIGAPGQTPTGAPALGAAQDKLGEAAEIVSTALNPSQQGSVGATGSSSTPTGVQPAAGATPGGTAPGATAGAPGQTGGSATPSPSGASGGTATGLKSSTVPANIEQANQDFSDDIDMLLTTIGDLTAQLKQDDGSLAMVNLWAEEMQSSLNAAYTQMVQDMQKQTSQQDPAVLEALKLIDEEMQVQRKELQDELAARGLGQSGILVEMRLRLERNALSSKERIIAGRLSELKSAMLTAISNFATHRSDLLRSAFEARVQAQQGAQNRRVNLQGQLTQAVGQVADVRQRQLQTLIGQQTAREQISSQEEVAARAETGANTRAKLQADTTITVTDKQEAGANTRTDKTITAQATEGQADRTSRETIAKGQTASAEAIARETRLAEERIADKRIAADAALVKLRIEADEVMNKFADDLKWQIAELEATTRKDIAEMQSKDQLKAGEMNQASNIVNSMLLPMIASGKISKQEILNNLAKSNYSPEVMRIYEQALNLMPGSSTSETSTSGSSKPATPTYSESPVLAEEQKGIETTQVRKLQEELDSVEARIKALEASYPKQSNKPTTPSSTEIPSFSITPKGQTASEIESLYQRRRDLRKKLGIPDNFNGTPTPATGEQ